MENGTNAFFELSETQNFVSTVKLVPKYFSLGLVLRGIVPGELLTEVLPVEVVVCVF